MWRMSEVENGSLERVPGGITAPQGFQALAVRAGLKTQGLDVAILACDEPAAVAGVFTLNRVKAAPVLLSAEHVRSETSRAVIVNAGNANCCTGTEGADNAKRMCRVAAHQLDCKWQEVLVCSTGIIGHPLPIEKIQEAVPQGNFSRGAETDESFARAIMTTDTRPKTVAMRARFGETWVTVGGAAKGVGMIGPNLGALTRPHATMLAFLTTDARVSKGDLQVMLQAAAERSFNSVTVDGDTSTNDTALLFASGASGVEITDDNEQQFFALLKAVCTHLTQEIARDGEGATKLVTVEVTGAARDADAKQIAMTIANSPLVKTAIFGRDPNWGRIAAAAGRAGVPFDAAKMNISLGVVPVFRAGEPLPFELAEAERAMSGDELTIRVELGEGESNWTAWTCDFSYDYVKINAEYHT